mmetsp:Transcript_22304/g.67828  ORF Transcript_22304/g.67828 Transcript_22304/m.67828 type:complete len:381 (-) Transcript_22304:218-1360(-)
MPFRRYFGMNDTLAWEQRIRMEHTRSFGVPKAAHAAAAGVPMQPNVAGGAVQPRQRDWSASVPAWSHLYSRGLYTLAPGIDVQPLAQTRPLGPPAGAPHRGGRDGNILQRIRKEERAAIRSNASLDVLYHKLEAEEHVTQEEIDRAERKARDFPRLDTREDIFPGMRKGRHHLHDRSLVGFEGLALSGDVLLRSKAQREAEASAKQDKQQEEAIEMAPPGPDPRAFAKEERRAQIRELKAQLRAERLARSKLEDKVSAVTRKSTVEPTRPRTAASAADLRSLTMAPGGPSWNDSEMSKQATCHRNMFSSEAWRMAGSPPYQRPPRGRGMTPSLSAPSFGGLAAPAWTLRHSPQVLHLASPTRLQRPASSAIFVGRDKRNL